MQADRCCGVGLHAANAALEKAPANEQTTAAPKSVWRTLVMMKVSLEPGRVTGPRVRLMPPCRKIRSHAVTVVTFWMIARPKRSGVRCSLQNRSATPRRAEAAPRPRISRNCSSVGAQPQDCQGSWHRRAAGAARPRRRDHRVAAVLLTQVAAPARVSSWHSADKKRCPR
jgi:hypothetical protein